MEMGILDERVSVFVQSKRFETVFSATKIHVNIYCICFEHKIKKQLFWKKSVLSIIFVFV
jgi:hypothetical protein